MPFEGRSIQRLRQQIGSVVGSSAPNYFDLSTKTLFSNEVILDIYVLGPPTRQVTLLGDHSFSSRAVAEHVEVVLGLVNLRSRACQSKAHLLTDVDNGPTFDATSRKTHILRFSTGQSHRRLCPRTAREQRVTQEDHDSCCGAARTNT